ncbi:MAG: oxidoreductase [Solirubrobacterales bacterium]|nr:oxidoreductase [Solirubrobacterales bacterium]
MAGSDEAFSELSLALDGPMFVVTTAAADDGERSGCLIGFGTPSSIDPQRFIACLSQKNHTYRVARRATHLAIHVAPAVAVEVARLFGGETGDEIDKFAHCAWSEGPHGMPLLDECPNRFVGEIVARHEVGDHDAFLLAPVWAEHHDGDPPLRFTTAREIAPGHPA